MFDSVTPSESVTVITTVIPLLVIITVDDQAMITFDHSSVNSNPDKIFKFVWTIELLQEFMGDW